ncbi:phospholipase D family protein [Mesorhizobium calcicola]|uniref:Phospholipase D family protein n=1 Tax=Mesorhizobium calcicola TaxID=1300310 RepID=A0ABW4WQN2_9HYPH
MSAAVDNWPALSFLEALRPGPDEHIELALLASYSADLTSIGATLLALAGKDSDAGRGSPSDLADAVERLRGKMRIVIQRGRLAKMRRTPRIAAVLDQFVREVDFDEAKHSWHPKAALVRTRNNKHEVGWRLWIGSRNLTECVNRDMGLLLVSGRDGAKPISGSGDLARALAERAALNGIRPASLASAVSKIAWRAPPGVTVERIRWSTGSGALPLPVPPVNADEVVVVSPFIDKSFLASQTPKEKKPPRRVLLTTMREIERLGPSLIAFDELLALDAPDYPAGDPEPEAPQSHGTAEPTAEDDEEEEIGLGLHAKLLFVRVGRDRTLWVGSANATNRAWSGRNVEVMAELRVTEAVEKGLKALTNSARLVSAPEKEYEPDAAVVEEEALERARAQVAARWAATLSFDGDEARLQHISDIHPDGPHPEEVDFVLEAGSLQGQLTVWPRDSTRLQLGAMPLSERSEFVRLRVSRGEKGLSWLQRAPVDPPFGEERDRAAFVRLLGARGFLLWLAGLLADDGRDEGDWTTEKRKEPTLPSQKIGLDPGLPTLEEILAAWSRDRQKFREIERRVSEYLPAVREQAKHEDAQAGELLRRFENLWRKLKEGLGDKGKGR